MNDITNLTAQTLSRDAALNTLVYLVDSFSNADNGTTVSSIVYEIRKNLDLAVEMWGKSGHTQDEIQKEYGEKLRQLTAVENAIRNDPGMGNLVIANQTNKMNDPATGRPYEENGISACTFQDSRNHPTDVTVVFRGTEKGEWYDNGIGLSGETTGTAQQIQATSYFDHIVKTNGWDQSHPSINVTGHSKGGNKTQYVVMTSEYSNLIVSGYSMDGQCMSQEAIDYMRRTLGEEEFERRRAKLFSISADNDYVNVLGVNNQDGRLIPEDHIYYLKSNLSGVAWHYPDCYMNEDGTLTDFTEQGFGSRLIQGISEAAMDLPVPIRSIITEGAMGIAQMTLGENVTPVNGESFSYADVLTSVPLLLETLPGGLVNFLGDRFGISLDWYANALTAHCMLVFTPLNAITYNIGKAIDYAIMAADKLKQLGLKCKDLTEKFVQYVDNGVKKVQSWMNSIFNPGSTRSSNSPIISLDSQKLLSYASRLANVNSRINRLDQRMDRLYRSVGLLDLWDLMQADILTGYSWRLARCRSYLSDTANDFIIVERKLVNQ